MVLSWLTVFSGTNTLAATVMGERCSSKRMLESAAPWGECLKRRLCLNRRTKAPPSKQRKLQSKRRLKGTRTHFGALGFCTFCSYVFLSLGTHSLFFQSTERSQQQSASLAIAFERVWEGRIANSYPLPPSPLTYVAGPASSSFAWSTLRHRNSS